MGIYDLRLPIYDWGKGRRAEGDVRVFNFKLLVLSWDGAREDREGGEGKAESGK